MKVLTKSGWSVRGIYFRSDTVYTMPWMKDDIIIWRENGSIRLQSRSTIWKCRYAKPMLLSRLSMKQTKSVLWSFVPFDWQMHISRIHDKFYLGTCWKLLYTKHRVNGELKKRVQCLERCICWPTWREEETIWWDG